MFKKIVFLMVLLCYGDITTWEKREHEKLTDFIKLKTFELSAIRLLPKFLICFLLATVLEFVNERKIR